MSEKVAARNSLDIKALWIHWGLMIKTGAEALVGERTKSALNSLDSASDGPNKQTKEEKKKRKQKTEEKKRKKKRRGNYTSFIHRTPFENLLCTRHCFRFQENISKQTTISPCPHGPYILQGKDWQQHNKYVI